jgi:hypothetical protein
MLHRADEIGHVCIQHYGANVRVAAFLPGRVYHVPGDTPKVEPNKAEWCSSSFKADEVFDKYIQEAYACLWQNYEPEQSGGVTIDWSSGEATNA